MLRATVWLVGMALAAAPAFSGEVAGSGEDKTLSPYFFVENGDPALDQVPLEATKVDVAISGVVAEVRVTQVYRNRGTRPINARYVFPASTRAAVHGMHMRVGDHRITAKIRERAQARAEFTRAVASGKSAALLEESRPNVFHMNVANILPGDRIEVDLDYTELLLPEEGVYEFLFPTVVGPRYANVGAGAAPERDRFVASPYQHQGEEPLTTFDIRAELATAVPLHDLTCTSHRVAVERRSASQAVVRLGESERHGGDRDFILRYRLSGEAIASGLLLHEGPDESTFLAMLQPPARVAPQDLPPREYVFVVDVSGSMSGFPLEVSKRLLRDLIGRLRPTDTFNLVLFAGAAAVMAPRSVVATSANVQRALDVIDDQRGGGGTELHAALVAALGIPRVDGVSRSVVLVTDGYITAESDVFDLIARHLGQTNFFAFGIGSGVNRYLIEGVARAGRGEPFVVTRETEAAAIADRFRRYIESPLLTGLSVSFDGFEAYDLEPASFPDLLAERPLVVLGKWRGPRAGHLVIRGLSGSGPYEHALDVSETLPAEVNRALPRLWARSRIASLADYGVSGAAQRHRDQLVALGLRYSLLTPFTSFIAIYEKIRNSEGPATDVDQPLPLPQGVSDNAVGMMRASEPGVVLLLPALGAALWLRRRRVR